MKYSSHKPNQRHSLSAQRPPLPPFLSPFPLSPLQSLKIHCHFSSSNQDRSKKPDSDGWMCLFDGKERPRKVWIFFLLPDLVALCIDLIPPRCCWLTRCQSVNCINFFLLQPRPESIKPTTEPALDGSRSAKVVVVEKAKYTVNERKEKREKSKKATIILASHRDPLPSLRFSAKTETRSSKANHPILKMDD